MADVVVTGGGLGGLLTGLLLAKDGHRVTVVERDGAEAVPPAAAWDDWERRGVNQFRLGHFFQPQFKTVTDAGLPELAPALAAAGALRFNVFEMVPAEVSGGVRPDDDRFTSITARRPVFEAVVASLAEEMPGLEVRRGTAVEGLMTGASAGAGIPHVAGVRLVDGTELRADLVVDAMGRRSPLPAWLEAIGAPAPVEELEDSGFVYYGRHLRSPDGSLPVMIGPLVHDGPTASVLTLPADNGTWAIVVVATADDASLRGLREPDRWTKAVRSFPLAAHWADGEPLEDRVVTMAKIEDRHRSLVDDGRPVATGVLAVADAWACTNPSLGWGATMAALHATALVHLLRTAPEDPVELAMAWHEVTEETVKPWYRTTVEYDRHRLREIETHRAGGVYEPGDPAWELGKALVSSGPKDPDCFRAAISVVGMVELPDKVLADSALLDKVIALGAGWRDEPALAPTRDELVAIAAR